MSQKTYARSFAGGEISPLLYGRLDLAKHQTGLAKCLNFITTPQGPVENRPGFAYVNKTKANGACLIPFTYNSEQSFALEFGNQYIRFHTLGGTLLATGVPITSITVASPAVFTRVAHGFTNGQWVYLSGLLGMTALNGRWGVVTGATADTYSLNDLFGAAINTTGMPAYTGSGTAARVYEISTPYATADLFNLHYVQSADVLTIVHQGYAPRELRRLGATNWTLTTISFTPTIAAPAAPTLTTAGPGGGTPIGHTYVTTAVAAGTLEESSSSASAGINWDLTVAGNTISIDPAAVTGGVRYYIYKRNGGVEGYIGQSNGDPFTDNNIVPDMGKTPPLPNDPFTTDFPRAASYYEQRRVFGGTTLLPQTIWATRSATESNMTYSIPTQDDDSITARIVAREANTVRHLVPLNDLLALTSGGVWRLAASDNGALTPATFSAKPQGYVGASNVQPVVTGSSVLYAPDRGAHIREVSYNWETQTYQAEDISVLAPHLVNFKNIIQLTYSKTPNQGLWAVRDDGVLLGLTHQPEHDVKAWHQHDTAGTFKSMCAIPEGDEDGVYALVQRSINSQTVEYVERLHSRQFTALADAFFVDCGATYAGAAATTISGLHHLEGKEVAVLADGGVHPARTVAAGAITLASAASKVQVGLAYNSDFQTLPLAMEMAALGQAQIKNVSEIRLRVYQTSGVKAGPDFDNLSEYPQRLVTDDLGTPPAMHTGVIKMKLTPKWQEDGSVAVRQSNPLPVTILSLSPDVATGG